MRALTLILLAVIATGCSKGSEGPAIAMSDRSSSKGLFISWKHPVSRRTAILEEMDGMVWLYLTAPNSQTPDRDCPAFATGPLADTVDWESIAKTGEPPKLTKDVASATALIEHVTASEFTTTWSSDGESVALVRGGEIICMIVAGAQKGHSRAIAKQGPLGLPFDEALAQKTFPARK
jgi:hypothetical protein